MLFLPLWKQLPLFLTWVQFPHQRAQSQHLLKGGKATLLAPNGPHVVSPDYRLSAVWFFHMVFPNKNPEHPISVLPACLLNSRGIRSWL